MEYLVDIVLELALEFIFDGAELVLERDEIYRKYPKGVRTLIVALAILVVLVVISVLVGFGVWLITDGSVWIGIFVELIAVAFVAALVLKVRKIYGRFKEMR